MIREILDSSFIKERIVELAVQLEKRTVQFPTAPTDVQKAAEELQVTAKDLDQAREVVAELARTGDYTRKDEEAAWIPCDPYLSIVQSALENFYRQANAVETVVGRGLGEAADPISDSSLKAEWVPTASRGLAQQA